MQSQTTRRTQRLLPSILAMISLAVGFFAGSAHADSVENLLKNLQSGDPALRAESADKASEAGATALYDLAKLLDLEDVFVTHHVRLAMENIVNHSTRPGAEAERAEAAKQLARLIRPEASDKVLNQALFHLANVGTAAQVPLIGEQLFNPAVREEAARTLEEIPGPEATQALAAALNQVPDSFKRRLLIALGRRHDTGAVPALAKFAKQAPADLQVDILDALVDSGSLPAEKLSFPLSTLLSERDADRIPDLLLRAADIQREQGKLDAALALYKGVLEGAVGEHLVCGALIGIGKLEDPGTLGLIGEYLSNEYASVRGVTAKIVTDWPGTDVDSTLKTRFEEARGDEKAALLQILVQRQSEGVADILKKALDDDNASVRVQAYEVLGEEGSEDLASKFLEAASDSEAVVAQAARRAYLRLADRIRAKGDGSKALSMVHQALGFSGDPEAVRMALQGVAGMANPESVAKVKPLLEEGGTAEPAARCYLALAEAIGNKGNRAKRIEMIHEIVHHPNSGDIRNMALRQLKDLGEETDVFTRSQGFINSWHVIGTFPNEHGSAYRKEYFPEKEVDLAKGGEYDGKKLEWQKVVTDEIPGKISMSSVFSENQFVTSYAYVEIEAPEEMPVTLLFGTNDGCELWVNGEKMFEVNEERGCTIDGDAVKPTLKKGKNTVLLKVLQAGGGWEYCMRLADKDGHPIDLTKNTMVPK